METTIKKPPTPKTIYTLSELISELVVKEEYSQNRGKCTPFYQPQRKD